MNSENFSDRLRKALRYRQILPSELATRTNISKCAISQYLSNKFAPRQNRVYEIANALNVSPAWLMGFDVEMEEQPKIITFTPDTNPTTQKLLVFNKNGIPGAHEKVLPSDDVLNEINKLVNALRPYPAEQIHTLLEIVENGGNLRFDIDLPPEHRELLSVISNLSKENIKTLIQVAKSMK